MGCFQQWSGFAELPKEYVLGGPKESGVIQPDSVYQANGSLGPQSLPHSTAPEVDLVALRFEVLGRNQREPWKQKGRATPQNGGGFHEEARKPTGLLQENGHPPAFEAWSYHIGLKSVKDQKEKVIALGNNWAGAPRPRSQGVRGQYVFFCSRKGESMEAKGKAQEVLSDGTL